MPRIILPIPDSHETVTRPVMLDVVRRIFDETGIPDNTFIMYADTIERTSHQGSTIHTDVPPVRFNNSNLVVVEVEETAEEDRVLSTAVMRPESVYLFRDDRIQTFINPVYSNTSVAINFRYRTTDKSSAAKWRDMIKARISNNRSEQVFNVSYSYLLPEEFILILKELHRLRESVAGYSEDWDTYFKANTTPRIRTLSNLAGGQQRIGVGETQMRIVGWYDWTAEPELGSKEDEGDTWTISFQYRFRYEKPTVCFMGYPIIVHNQVLGLKWRPGVEEQSPYDPAQMRRHYNNTGHNLSHFEVERETSVAAVRQGYAIPAFDDFIPMDVIPDTRRIFTALLSVDVKQPRRLINLLEIPKLKFDPSIVRFMKSEYKFLTKVYESVFLVSFYRGTRLQPARDLVIDANLDVWTTYDLDPREYYHLRLALVTNLADLTNDAVDRFKKDADAAIKIIDVIDPSLKDKDKLPPSKGPFPGVIPKKDIDVIVVETDKSRRPGNDQVYSWNTVGSLIIETHHAAS